MTECGDAAITGDSGAGMSVADGVGSVVGWLARSSLEMRAMASRPVARALSVRTTVADARCRFIHPMMSIVLTMPRMIMATSNSMSVTPAWLS